MLLENVLHRDSFFYYCSTKSCNVSFFQYVVTQIAKYLCAALGKYRLLTNKILLRTYEKIEIGINPIEYSGLKKI